MRVRATVEVEGLDPSIATALARRLAALVASAAAGLAGEGDVGASVRLGGGGLDASASGRGVVVRAVVGGAKALVSVEAEREPPREAREALLAALEAFSGAGGEPAGGPGAGGPDEEDEWWEDEDDDDDEFECWEDEE